jgi:hypothetical protein
MGWTMFVFRIEWSDLILELPPSAASDVKSVLLDESADWPDFNFLFSSLLQYLLINSPSPISHSIKSYYRYDRVSLLETGML